MENQIPTPKEPLGDIENSDMPIIEYGIWQGDSFALASSEEAEQIRGREREQGNHWRGGLR